MGSARGLRSGSVELFLQVFFACPIFGLHWFDVPEHVFQRFLLLSVRGLFAPLLDLFVQCVENVQNAFCPVQLSFQLRYAIAWHAQWAWVWLFARGHVDAS